MSDPRPQIEEPRSEPERVEPPASPADIAALHAEIARLKEDFRTVSDLAVRLSTELEPAALLPGIVAAARKLTASEAGSLYVLREGKLVFVVAQNDSVALDPAVSGELPRIELAVAETSLAGLAALKKTTLIIDDASQHPSYSRKSSDRMGYRVQSMLVFPLVDHRGDVLGVLQLMNRKVDGALAPYSQDHATACEVLAAHAGTAMEISSLYSELNAVFDSLVRFTARAIDARDPATAGHSARVAMAAVRIAEAMGGFSAAELRELRFAGILHDVGKIGVRECVLTKAEKVAPEGMAAIACRFAAAAEASISAGHRKSEGVVDHPALAQARLQALALREELTFLQRIVIPGWMDDADDRRLDDIAAQSWTDWQGDSHALLLPDELVQLRVRKGTLTDAERAEIENHAELSHHFLAQIPFPRDLARVPEIAWSHHEKMDGSGYPRGLAGEQILAQARILAVADVFDALTAEDRPYKKAMAPQKAVSVIEHESERGAWDPVAVAVLRRLVDAGELTPARLQADVDDEFIAERDAWR